MIKMFGILAGGALLASTVAIAQSADQSATDSIASASALGRDVDLTRGAKAWADHCGRCHNLRSPSELGENAWDVSVTHMRARANLPGDLADDIKAFLMYSAQSTAADAAPIEKTAAGAAYAHLKPGDAVRGGELYSQTCIACHSANGEGAFEGVPNLMIVSGRLSKPDEILLANMINGFQSAGSPMAMPPRGGNPDLTDQDLAHVLAYLRTQFEERTGDPERK